MYYYNKNSDPLGTLTARFCKKDDLVIDFEGSLGTS